MDFRYLLALHIIFIVTWFAGLFYIVRLFVYQTEAYDKPEEARKVLLPQYKLMSKRLWYGITWPSAILTLVFGLSIVYTKYLTYGITIPAWLWVKFSLVFLLYAYHFACHYLFNRLMQDRPAMSAQKLRGWNEVATIFLISIVFLVKLQSSLSMLWGIIGLLVFTAVLMAAIKLYKRSREGKG
ncbi:CopD family protein [Roseivirga sp. BDSF3-8]|uniref:CopD family protein n=1 Tax=Roseivirga sp. BDSF3-8 TaxID=3241598 RepID=UPI003531AC40